MKDPFHETKETLNVTKREVMAVNSLSVVTCSSTMR